MPVCESLQISCKIPVAPSNAIQPERKLKAVPNVTGITADRVETEYKDRMLRPFRMVLTQIKVKWNEIHDG